MTPRQRFLWWIRFHRSQAAGGLVVSLVLLGSFGGIAAAAFSGGGHPSSGVSIPTLPPLPSTVPSTTTIPLAITVAPTTTTLRPKAKTAAKPKPKTIAKPKPKPKTVAKPTPTTVAKPKPKTVTTTAPATTTTTVPAPIPADMQWFDAHRSDYQKLSGAVIVAWVDLEHAQSASTPAGVAADQTKLHTELQALTGDLPMPSHAATVSVAHGLSELNAGYLGFASVFADLAQGQDVPAAAIARSLQQDLRNGQLAVNAALIAVGVPASQLLPAPGP